MLNDFVTITLAIGFLNDCKMTSLRIYLFVKQAVRRDQTYLSILKSFNFQSLSSQMKKNQS